METIKIEMTLMREGKKDIRVELALFIENDEIQLIDMRKLLTIEETN